MSIAVAILTHHDIPRLRRAIRSVKNQENPCYSWVEVNSIDEKYVEAVRQVCADEVVDCNVSDPKKVGTPGKGKQAVFDRFKSLPEEMTHVLLLDGDDWLYPCAIGSLERMLIENLTIDAMHVYQHDSYVDGKTIMGQGGTPFAVMRDPLHRGESTWVWTDVNPEEGSAAAVPMRPTFFSKRACKVLKWEPSLYCYEDGAFVMASLKAHQDGLITTVNCLTQDLMIYDCDTPDSVQKNSDYEEWTAKMRAVVKRKGPPKEQTSMGECPTIRPAAFINEQEKIQFIHRTAGLIDSMAEKKLNPTKYVFLRKRMSVDRMNAMIRYCEDVVGFAGATFVDGRHRECQDVFSTTRRASEYRRFL